MELQIKTQEPESDIKAPVLPELEEEIEPTLCHLNPEIQDEIRELAHSGHAAEAESELIDYLVKDNHFSELRRMSRRKWYRDEWFMDDRLYWLALIPVGIAFYCIFSLLFTGHIRLP